MCPRWSQAGARNKIERLLQKWKRPPSNSQIKRMASDTSHQSLQTTAFYKKRKVTPANPQLHQHGSKKLEDNAKAKTYITAAAARQGVYLLKN